MRAAVNEILGNHNVDKQISDSKGDVAYMMADVSDVQTDDLKEISESLEALSCKCASENCKGQCTNVKQHVSWFVSCTKETSGHGHQRASSRLSKVFIKLSCIIQHQRTEHTVPGNPKKEQ